MNRNGPLSDYYHRLYQASIGLTDVLLNKLLLPKSQH